MTLSSPATAAPHGGPPAPIRTSGLAVAGLACGILGLCTFGLSAILGLVVSVIALRRIVKSRGHLGGKGLAIAGLALSVATLAIGLVLLGILVVCVLNSELGDQLREIWNNFKNGDDDSEFIAEPPQEALGLPLPSLAGPHLGPGPLGASACPWK